MTAEIAILNKHAVALAADSKVSITGPSGAKTYDSVNKVFTLSKIQPVGIMIFGSAEFMQYPWELIIKSYRSHLGSGKFDTLQQYAENFLEYAMNFGDTTSTDVDQNVYSILVTSLVDDLKLAREQASEFDIKIGSPSYVEHLSDYFEGRCKDLRADLYFDTISSILSVCKRHEPQIEAVISATLSRYKSPALNKSAKRYCYAILISQELSALASGIVVAGYGDLEIFPSIAEYNTDGIIGDTTKTLQSDITSITKQRRSCIRSFAQHDMVQTFMNGVDGTFMQIVCRTFMQSMQDMTSVIIDKYGTRAAKKAAIRERISNAVEKESDQIVDELWDFTSKYYINPVTNTVAILPKDEMANLAESLVALTSVKRRVSSELESVGGPIDVAVISKGDGFIWIKRKHYFSDELNHHFSTRYFDDV